MRTRLYSKMTGKEIREYLARKDLIFVPIGTVETHGKLPLDVEYIGPLGNALATRERVDFFHRQLTRRGIFFQLILDIFFDCLCVLAHCVHIIAAAPKFSVSVLVPCISPLLKYHQTALPFQISHKTRH